jgi:hypothetical protein
MSPNCRYPGPRRGRQTRGQAAAGDMLAPWRYASWCTEATRNLVGNKGPAAAAHVEEAEEDV